LDIGVGTICRQWQCLYFQSLDLGITFSINLSQEEVQETNTTIFRTRGMLLSAGFSIYPWQ